MPRITSVPHDTASQHSMRRQNEDEGRSNKEIKDRTRLDVFPVVQSFTHGTQCVSPDRLFKVMLLRENETLLRALHGVRRIQRDLACDIECGR